MCLSQLFITGVIFTLKQLKSAETSCITRVREGVVKVSNDVRLNNENDYHLC